MLLCSGEQVVAHLVAPETEFRAAELRKTARDCAQRRVRFDHTAWHIVWHI